MIPAFLIIAMAVVSMAVNPGYFLGNLSSNCEHFALVMQNNHTGLRAQCQGHGNTTQCSILDLNDCFGYITANHGFDPVDHGGFNRYMHPKTCRLESDLRLDCQLLSDIHRRIFADLNRGVVNDEGWLKCFENKAVAPPDCATRPAFSDGGHLSGTRSLVASFGMVGAFVAFVMGFLLCQ
ncbi:uncharacterized protein F4822DRAFT_441161 [Hypoxylon trugodes]|uniref:uncharacterized protein n=1 Tax=Hypoxylon trugodes TaxID=326681 RepID=UPI00219CD85F|nr:uncharacterized protein F4822DRAFT_441161 [Hypoxylon trugodes]KAI1391983.1 hypothetical protein F4822DRAFT_441161 [Hypoxylon trugodes]